MQSRRSVDYLRCQCDPVHVPPVHMVYIPEGWKALISLISGLLLYPIPEIRGPQNKKSQNSSRLGISGMIAYGQQPLSPPARALKPAQGARETEGRVEREEKAARHQDANPRPPTTTLLGIFDQRQLFLASAGSFSRAPDPSCPGGRARDIPAFCAWELQYPAEAGGWCLQRQGTGAI